MRRGAGSALLVLGVLGHGLAFAATIETADSKERRPQPAEGSEVEVSFNPTVAVMVWQGETIESLLLRLAGEINIAGTGSYVARALTEVYTVEILRQDGSEIDQLRVVENDPGIQSTRLTVNMPGLEASLRLAGETPSKGAVIVTLNDRIIPVTTTGLDASRLEAAMLRAIRNADFAATMVDGEIHIIRDLRNDSGLTRVGFRSTDPALVTSECALEPSMAAGQLSPQEVPTVAPAASWFGALSR